MAKFFSELDPSHVAFIAEQKIFFTATALPTGRINLSPKGLDTLRCLSPRQIAYLDLTGSGNETAAHLQHDGRMTLMFCSFSKHPLILRVYGRGTVTRPKDEGWQVLAPHFPATPGTRQIIVLDVDSVQTSCGYAVPIADTLSARDTLVRLAEKKGEAGILEYQREHNQRSIDGLPIEST